MLGSSIANSMTQSLITNFNEILIGSLCSKVQLSFFIQRYRYFKLNIYLLFLVCLHINFVEFVKYLKIKFDFLKNSKTSLMIGRKTQKNNYVIFKYYF